MSDPKERGRLPRRLGMLPPLEEAPERENEASAYVAQESVQDKRPETPTSSLPMPSSDSTRVEEFQDIERAADNLVAPPDELELLGHRRGSSAPQVEVSQPLPSTSLPRVVIEWVTERPRVQLGLLVAAAIAGWWIFSAPAASPAFDDDVAPTGAFPDLHIEADDGVAQQDIGKLLRQAELNEARRAAEARMIEEATRPPPRERHALEPGEIYDAREGKTRNVPRAKRPWTERRSATKPINRAVFFKPGGVLEIPNDPEAIRGQTLALDVGTRIPARLMVGASSGSRRAVLATTTKAVKTLGVVVLEKGAILRGRASANGSDQRLFLDFDEARVAGERYRFEGYAVGKGNMPGLRAHRHEASLEARSRSGAAGGAIGASGEIVNEVAGQSLVGRVARGVARGTVPEAQREVAIARGFTLEVAPGTSFEVLVVGGER